MSEDISSVTPLATPSVVSRELANEPATPSRVQLRRTKGWKMPSNTVKVDRTTGWGNPFPVQKVSATSCGVTTPSWTVGTFEGPGMWIRPDQADAQVLAVRAYRSWVSPALIARASHELRGKNLACWCKIGSPCHADVLLELANALEGVATNPESTREGTKGVSPDPTEPNTSQHLIDRGRVEP